MENRTIKFRGKNVRTGQWLYGDYHCEGNTRYITKPSDYLREHAPIEFIVDAKTIGQFTGVTDEYGKEVFEGDVLEANYKYDRLGYNGGVDPDNDCICYGVVEFDNDALQWVLNIYKSEYPISKQIEEDECSLFPLCIFGHESGYDNCNLKIIGNIHDNPSLISKKQ